MSMEKSTENSGFLDGREYTAAFLYEFCALLVGNGVYANELAPTATNDNMTITHGSGHAWINGVLYKNATPFNLDIDTADGALNRYDSLMLRLDLSQNETYAVIVKGAFAASPTPPEVTRNAETFDLKICDIYIPAGCTKITQDLITDTRLDASVCGVPVFPVEHLDMTTFYRQVATDLDNLKKKEQAEILELLQQLNDLVESDTVGKLIAEINKKLPKDGTEPMAADLPMGGFKVTGLGTPKDYGDAVPLGYAKQHFDPAGHGLGGSKLIDTDIDNFTTPGWYHWEKTTTIGGITADFWFMHVKAYGIGTSACTQEIWPIKTGLTCKIYRHKRSGAWEPSEIENPPMEFGVEYRTTERWNGKAVYKKAINLGALPNETNKTVTHGIDSSATYISVDALAKKSGSTLTQPFPFINASGELLGKVQLSATGVIVYAFSDLSEYTASATLHYIKD